MAFQECAGVAPDDCIATKKYSFGCELRMRVSRLPIYPLALAAFPVLASYARNHFELQVVDVIRPLLATLLLAILVIAISFLIVRRLAAAFLVSLIPLAAVYFYSAAYDAASALGLSFVRHRYMLPIWCATALACYVIAVRRLRSIEDLNRATESMNLFGLVLYIVAAVSAILTLPASSAETSHAKWADELVRQSQVRSQHLPDIYYLILDGYARGDILKTRFHFDNDKFLEGLRARGFFVAERSHCNYPWTHLSLAATLNVAYLQDLLPKDFGAQAPSEFRPRYQYYVSKLGENYIRKNRTREFLEHLGYQWRAEDSGYAVTRQQDVAISRALLGPMTRFEEMLLRATIFRPAIALTMLAPPKYQHSRQMLAEFSEPAQSDGPSFIFGHLVAPHPPFCFDEHGNEVTAHPTFETDSWLQDRQAVPGYQDFYRTNYPRNVAGLNIYVMQCCDRLLAKTNGEAIIIIQSDHGSSLELYPDDLSKTDVPERFGVLNAIYLPSRYSREGLDASISSVNTFRVVLSNVFGVNLPKLEDRAWFSRGDLEFIEVTHRLRDGPEKLP